MGEIKQKDTLGFNGVGGEIRNGDFSVLQLEKEMRISTWMAVFTTMLYPGDF